MKNPEGERKLLRVDSEYYGGARSKRERHLKKKDEYVGKQHPHDEFDLIKINSEPDIQKMQKKKCPQMSKEVEGSGNFLGASLMAERVSEKKSNPLKGHRKRWSTNTLQREALLAIFNESKLFSGSFARKRPDDEIGGFMPNVSVDDMLRINPSEITGDFLKPVHPYEATPRRKQAGNNYLQLLQHEVEHLREKFELNNRNYQIEDLMRLTDNSKNILKLVGLQKCAEQDKKMGDSVYHDLECLRMTLEQKIGFSHFSQVYGKMNKIINDELDSAFKISLEKHINSTKTRVVNKIDVAGDNDDLIKNTWKSIIGVLGDKQEYLPDVWELAMSENICYHL